MVKDDTILYIGGGAAVLFILYKSDFFKGLSDVSSGVGSAVSGAGTTIRETLISGGETIREIFTNVQSVTDTATNKLINPTITETGGLITDTLGESSGLRGIEQGVGGAAVNLADFLKQFTKNTTDEVLEQQSRVLSWDNKIIDAVKGIFSGGSAGITGASVSSSVSPVNLVIGGSSSVALSAAKYFSTEKENPSVVLPSSSSSVRKSSSTNNYVSTPIKGVYITPTGGMSIAPELVNKLR